MTEQDDPFKEARELMQEVSKDLTEVQSLIDALQASTADMYFWSVFYAGMLFAFAVVWIGVGVSFYVGRRNDRR